MNWKFEAADKLRNYAGCRQALETIPLEIQRLESEMTRIRSASADKTAVSGGGNKREDAMLSNIVHREELERRLKEAELYVEVVDRGLQALDDEKRLILDKSYIHWYMGSVSDLCEQLCVDRTTVYRKRETALRQFTFALYGAIETP